MDGLNAGHIVTASVLGAPAGLLMAKVMWPETEPSETGDRHHFATEKTAQNSIDAICQGASEGAMLSINVLAMLIAFVALVALAGALFVWPQTALGMTNPLTIEQVLGWLNAPFAWLLGIPSKDCAYIGQILGERIVLNEFVGYLHLSATSRQTRRSSPTAPSPSRAMPCAASPISPASPSRSAASARWSRSAAPTWPGSACGRWSPVCWLVIFSPRWSG